MKVSVVIVAHNIERYIERCLSSIINQTLNDIEIIVVNDGSTDGTCEKIQKLSSKDLRIKVINQKNKGTQEARKSGLDIAQGEYILFVDGDDWLEFNALQILYENAKRNNSDIVLYHAFKAYDNEKEILHTFSPEINEYSLKEFFIGNISPWIWSKLIRLDYMKSTNVEFLPNISFAEDLAMVGSLLICDPKVSVEDTPLYNYYRRSDSITNKVNSKILELDQALIFIKEILQDKGIYLGYKNEFECLVFRNMFAIWFLIYVTLEKEYNFDLYKIYKNYNINTRINPYIRKEMSTYPLSLKIRSEFYNYSYNLGKLYDKIRLIFGRVE